MNAAYKQATISSFSDEAIIEEAARRLQTAFERANSKPLLFGSFRFIFHDGRFQSVEDWPRNRSYRSNVRPKSNEESEGVK